MSPVSRGRKSKRSNKRAKPCRSNPPEKVSAYRGPSVAPGSAAATLNRLLGPPERPSWFDESIKRVLDNARVVMSASGPRELDQLTAELLGAELHRAVHRERQGMWFGWWFAGLVEAETDRIEEAAGKSSAEPLLWLLHGLAAMAPPSLRSKLMAPNRAITRSRELPPWLSEVPRLAATGEVCRMRDAYGTRSAV
ncbi:MAG: hypothetical protein H0V92_02165, partial [Pseudonocardiales bacterium]|nr:hypothetical protein [Pseudonocardiales bacterium]